MRWSLFSVFSHRAALLTEVAHINLVLTNPLMIVLCFADVQKRALCAENLVHHTSCFVFRGPIFGRSIVDLGIGWLSYFNNYFTQPDGLLSNVYFQMYSCTCISKHFSIYKMYF